MTHTLQLRLLTALTLFVPTLVAQTSPDPSGHWKGAILAPGRQFRFEVDLTGSAGFAALPDENMKGIPLRVKLEGKSIKFHAREDQPFDGVLSPDAKSIDGETVLEGYTLPFHMSRTGEANLTTPEKGVSVAANVEGEWLGSIEVNGATLRLLLKMSNNDGGSTASIIDVDQGGLELPAVVRQSAPSVAVEITGGATWNGTLNPAGPELVGRYSERGKSVPLTFHRAAK